MSIFTWAREKINENRNRQAYDDYLRVEFRKEWDEKRKMNTPLFGFERFGR